MGWRDIGVVIYRTKQSEEEFGWDRFWIIRHSGKYFYLNYPKGSYYTMT